MFINDVNKKEEIKNIAVKHLRELGVKYRPKKPRNIQDARIGRQCFKTALCLLPMQTVTLVSGQQLIVPKLLDDLCSFILANVSTEGLFRKGGSKARQNDIKLLLDSGSYLGASHHEIDVANVLKTFFRELPEPLFPFSFHELFLHCALSSQQLEALLLSCLLLPTEHLNTLAYFMQFLHEVSEHSHLNKMDSHNLAIVIGPTLFPIEEKSALNSTQRLKKFCDICKLLIENASNIGFISDRIIDQIAPASLSVDLVSSNEGNAKQKKKRRSGSLTRMFNGLRKIVSSKSIDISTKSPDPLQTPNIKVSERKRRLDIQAFSNKKKHTLIQSLPQHTALSTPISVHPNPKKNLSPKSTSTSINTDKKWSLSKRNKQDRSNISSTLQRRWSAVSNATPGFKRNKMRNSCMVSSVFSHKEPEADYVKISRTEYEDIQNRVSAIEQRISLELDSAVETVQTVYESTLYKAEHLSPTDDHLARRLSKELKIRRSIDQRSPSARKIGTLRRRSRDLERQNNNRLCRNQSLQLPNQSAITLRRGQPNTLGMGLPNPSLIKVSLLQVKIKYSQIR
ncbi:hypothetical protein RI129_002237 [Pyrocoelia pectoralis]|uniref:Rho-GAP domain-containing protein n=1 Tax=Pyrocoelia pectoralis TaxID=417401 RepID=A0AAN7ZHS7_9COLE